MASKKDLAKELNVSKPTIDRQIDNLVKKNLLVRKSDGKIVVLSYKEKMHIRLSVRFAKRRPTLTRRADRKFEWFSPD